MIWINIIIMRVRTKKIKMDYHHNQYIKFHKKTKSYNNKNRKKK